MGYEGGGLVYQREGGPRHRLIALAADTFALEGNDAFRIRFVRDDAGRVTALVGMDVGGADDPSPRTS